MAAGIVTDTAGPAIAFVAPDPRPIAIAAARPPDPRGITLSTTQLLINQRISQAAVRRANALIARIEDGLLATDVRDGTLTALDLAPGVVVP